MDFYLLVSIYCEFSRFLIYPDVCEAEMTDGADLVDGVGIYSLIKCMYNVVLIGLNVFTGAVDSSQSKVSRLS